MSRDADEEAHRYIAGPMMEYGLEKGWVMDQHFYFGADLTWPIFYPDSFRLTSIEPYKMWLIPITHLRAGYIFSDQSLLTIGSTYLWGLVVSYCKPFSARCFWDMQLVKWLDEPWDGEIPFHKAIHDIFGTMGFGYRF